MPEVVDLTIAKNLMSLSPGGSNEAARFVMVEGRRGTSKTRSILTLLVIRALRHPGSRVLLTRSSRTRLTDSVLATLEEQVLPMFRIPVPPGGRDNRHHYALPFGSTIIPMGLDDQSRTQSVETCWVYVAEGTELSSANDVLALTGAMRQNIKGVKHQCIVDCNPEDPNHWLNEIAEYASDDLRDGDTIDQYVRMLDFNNRPAPAGKWKRIITHYADNPAYWDVDNWTFSELGQRYIDGLGYLAGHLRARWLNGRWKAAEGSVYPEFDDRHIVTPFAIPSHWPWFLHYDPGYDHPTAVVWVAVSPAGRLYIADEIYESRKSVAMHCAEILARADGRNIRCIFGDPHHAFNRTAQSPTTIAEQAAECGVKMLPGPAAYDSVGIEAQVNLVRQKLVNNLDDGKPELVIFSTCKNTIREFRSWKYKRKADGSVPSGDDRFEDVNDDTMDCVRSIIASRPVYEEGEARLIARPQDPPEIWQLQNQIRIIKPNRSDL